MKRWCNWAVRLVRDFVRVFHETPPPADPSIPKLVLVGSPNVGKSLLFNRITGEYATVSNYPGTTVEVARALARFSGTTWEVVDTPGIYSLSPITDEELVTISILLKEKPRAVIHVADATNIPRMLGLTLQLAEAGLPVVLALNMSDEARSRGIRLDVEKLRKALGIPVVETVAATGQGTRMLCHAATHVQSPVIKIDYGPDLEPEIDKIAALLDEHPSITRRALAILLLQENPANVAAILPQMDAARAAMILQHVSKVRMKLPHSVAYHITLTIKEKVDGILTDCLAYERPLSDFREKLGNLLLRPVLGLPVLAVVLYFGLYQLVGKVAAGTVVDFLDAKVFERHVAPVAARVVSIIPWQTLQDLFVGRYGLVTLALRYALAIVLPIVAAFFLVFSLLEDSGYLPRLAFLSDRLFKRLGLSGRAVIPIVLGFGCGTMATVVTRTLETRREKIIATFLLALAIPCSAQLGLVLGLLSSSGGGLAAWAIIVTIVFLAVGTIAGKLLPGPQPSFYMEIPPMRIPSPRNVLAKTWSRARWYVREIIPIFLAASIILWAADTAGLFSLALRILTPPVRIMGLPPEAATAFIFGFFRRDYGAAGLYDLQKAGLLNGAQLATAAIALTLFIPCFPQFLIMKKERGGLFTIITLCIVSLVAWTVGFVSNRMFSLIGFRF